MFEKVEEKIEIRRGEESEKDNQKIWKHSSTEKMVNFTKVKYTNTHAFSYSIFAVCTLSTLFTRFK